MAAHAAEELNSGLGICYNLQFSVSIGGLEWTPCRYGSCTVYLDFNKAFDKVSHQTLIKMLIWSRPGITIIRQIHGWLQNGTERDPINGSFSGTR